jgi:predicted permease
VRLQHVPLGFEPDDVFTARVSLPGAAYSDGDRSMHFYDQLITTMRASGDVDAVGIATSAPFGPGVRASFQVRARREQPAPPNFGEGAAQHVVSDDYFRVLRIPLFAGRVFDVTDDRGSTPVAIVSERVARVVWPNANPLGQIVERDGKAYVVIGVVGDVRGSDTAGARGGGPEREPRAAVYFSANQSPQRTMTLLVRSKREPATVAATIRAAIRAADPSLPVQPVRRLDDWVTDSVAPARTTTTLSTVFALCALALASVGIYGVLGCFVASRTREIGVRMAMGATRQVVVRFVLAQGMRWAAGGIAIGMLGAFAASRLVATLLFEVRADDPMTFALAAAALSLVAMVACAIPAVRAVRIDPTVALRTE